MEGTYDTLNQVNSNQNVNGYSSDLPNYLHASEVMDNSYELIDYFKAEVENYELNNQNNHNDNCNRNEQSHLNDMEIQNYNESELHQNVGGHEYYLDNQLMNQSPVILPSFQVSDKIFELPPLDLDPNHMAMNYFHPSQMNYMQNDMGYHQPNPTNCHVKSDTSESTLSTPDGLKTGTNHQVDPNCMNMNNSMIYNNLNRYDLNFYNNQMYDINPRMNYNQSYPPPTNSLPQTNYRMAGQSYESNYDPRMMRFNVPNSSMYSLGMSLPYHPHSNLLHPAYQTKPVPQVNKRYRCSLCGKGFSRPSSLTTHTYSHTGEKPFKCTVEGCGRSFSVVSNLRRHGKVHMNQH